MKRSGCKNKEIAAALKDSIRTIERVKVPPSVETTVQIKKRLEGLGQPNHEELLFERWLKKGIVYAENGKKDIHVQSCHCIHEEAIREDWQ